ncbi:MAG: RluA family pseudouridine synthase, partial [Gemmatimonadota bacterium]|nr:RluA family pseudouridine synthase [Gemmatimonadota bacterium]
GTRLDRVLADLLSAEYSRSRLARLIRDGRILVNGRRARAGAPVAEGDSVTIDPPEPEESEITAEDLPIGVVYEDDRLAVVNKPAGMVTHPAGPLRTGTLVNALLFRLDGLSGIGGVLRPGIVHRLDKGTTGLLVVAKDDACHRLLSAQLEDRTLSRVYTAVAWGRVGPDRFTIDAPIGRHRRDRKRMAVVEGGRDARSHIEVEAAGSVASLLTVQLETGRTHQIRVHLAHRGHAMVADSDYGGGDRSVRRFQGPDRGTARRYLGMIERPALHAGRIGFRHPFRREAMAFEVPLPEDLAALVREVRRRAGE